MTYLVVFCVCLGLFMLRRRLLSRRAASIVAGSLAAALDPFTVDRGAYARDPITGRRDRLEL